MNLRSTVLAISGALLLALTACGGGSSQDPLVGTYVLDVDRTLSNGGAGKPDAAALQAIQSDFTPDAYRFELHDGTFSLSVGTSADPLVVEGTWERSAGGLELTHTEVNGAALTPEQGGEQVVEARVEQGWIVLPGDGQEIWLRKL